MIEDAIVFAEEEIEILRKELQEKFDKDNVDTTEEDQKILNNTQ